MNSQKGHEKFIWAASGALNATVIICLLGGFYHPWLIVLWIISWLVIFLPGERIKISTSSFFSKNMGLMLLATILPLLVRFFLINPDRLHGDEFVIAANSVDFDWARDNFFTSLPTRWPWPGGQTPAIMYVLQKIFLKIFGEDFLGIKLSGLPYVFLTSVFLYLLAKNLFGRIAAFLTLWAYSFLAIILYFDLLGGEHHLLGPMMTLTALLWALERFYHHPSRRWAMLAGVITGWNYFYYYTSFMALPLAVLFIIAFNKIQNSSWHKTLKNYFISFFLVFSPTLAQMIGERRLTLFLPRWDKIGLFNGEYSPLAVQSSWVEKLIFPFKSLAIFLMSFFKKGLGGSSGFDFEHQAMLGPFTGLLFIMGLGILIYWIYQKRYPRLLLLLLFGAWLLEFPGVVLTIPVASYHRFVAVLPLMALM
ncbi:MAG: glycosyltransferase family 39 protein, partial [Pseudomonadota bacterium]